MHLLENMKASADAFKLELQDKVVAKLLGS